MIALLNEFAKHGIVLNYIRDREGDKAHENGWHCRLDDPKGLSIVGIHVFGCATPIEALTLATDKFKEIERGIANE